MKLCFHLSSESGSLKRKWYLHGGIRAMLGTTPWIGMVFYFMQITDSCLLRFKHFFKRFLKPHYAELKTVFLGVVPIVLALWKLTGKGCFLLSWPPEYWGYRGELHRTQFTQFWAGALPLELQPGPFVLLLHVILPSMLGWDLKTSLYLLTVILKTFTKPCFSL